MYSSRGYVQRSVDLVIAMAFAKRKEKEEEEEKTYEKRVDPKGV
jgi:aromatic ring hydroxylase